ncbi:MAG: hypothetical protein A3E83_06340 [Gammaproteobacteria bacterium RIFCSPHIGHO2_12_FULL_41_20]|nr:MAG: hypothetical protein A3E83_06340 [Gammaproteobacteria bacterium RIFCSPHIGHO2_12_FULL_41_20]
MNTSRKEAPPVPPRTQTSPDILRDIPEKFRFLFEYGGPFKIVRSNMPKFTEGFSLLAAGQQTPSEALPVSTAKTVLSSLFSRATTLITRAEPAISNFAMLFEKFNLELSTIANKQVLERNNIQSDPASLLTLFIQKIILLNQLVEDYCKVLQKNLLEVQLAVREALKKDFAQWNNHPTASSPIDENIKKFSLEITQAQSQIRIAADKLTPYIQDLFGPAPALFALAPKSTEASLNEEACTRSFNEKIVAFFKTEIPPALTVTEIIPKGWKLISDYKGTGAPSAASLEQIFIKIILPKLHELEWQLTELGKVKAVSQSFITEVRQNVITSIRVGLPQLLSEKGDVVHPVQDSIDRVKALVEAEILILEQQQAASVTTALATPATAVLVPYEEFSRDAQSHFYHDNTGFYDIYISQVTPIDNGLVAALQELDTLVAQYVDGNEDNKAYKIELWNHIVDQVSNQGCNPECTVTACCEGMRKVLADFSQPSHSLSY